MFCKDLERLVYSTRTSFLVVMKQGNEIIIKTMKNGDVVFTVDMGGECSASFSEYEVNIKGADSWLNICLLGQDDLYFKGGGKGVVIKHRDKQGEYIADFVYEKDGGIFCNNCINDTFEWFTPIKGSLRADAPKKAGAVRCDYINIIAESDCDGEFEFIAERFYSPSIYHKYSGITYEKCIEEIRQNYGQWESRFNPQNDADREAVYVMWSNICPLGGNFKSEAMLMSKAGMISVWSWDNCFNALGLAKADCELALGQFLFPYHYMDEYGCMPDCISVTRIVRNFVKPPVQGWIYKKLVDLNGYFRELSVVEKIYPLMKKNTEWWLNFRTPLPYYSHGNDSGQDNASCFDKGSYTETGELAALLSVQCGVLADMAERLEMEADRKRFSSASQELYKISINDFFDGRLFVRKADTKEAVYSNSLLPYRVIVLEDKLPDNIKNYVVNSLKEHYITPHGIASEAVDSEYFEENGYWRGAVWAPDQVMFLLSLKAMGETELASELAKNYTDGLAENGFYENSSALNGRGLRCKSYTWTSAAYMTLKNVFNLF